MAQQPLFQFEPENLLSEQEAREVLRPFRDKFESIWRLSWDEYVEVPVEFRRKICSRTRSNMLHDLAVNRAREEFQSTDGVECCNALGFFKIYIGECLVLRLKRVARDTNLAMNIQTKQQKKWYAHRPIEGVRPDRTRLIVGYTLDSTATDIEHVVATLQLGVNSLAYSFRLDGDWDPPVTPVAPAPPSSPPLPETGPKVRLKRRPDGEGQ